MRVVDFDQPGPAEVLHLREAEEPVASSGHVVIEAAAAGLNYADLLQRTGRYGLKPGTDPRLGLECSGTITQVASDVTQFRPGDQVCALMTGGAYAERVAVDHRLVTPVPAGVQTIMAAAFPEVTATVWSNLFDIGGLRPAATVLIHGGSGGVGSGAVQIAAALGARVFTTCGSDQKAAFCRALGAEVAFNYRHDDFVDAIRHLTDGVGVDIVLDNMGASYLDRNIAAAAPDGRIIIIGLQGGKVAEMQIDELMEKRLSLHVTSLRDRPEEQRARIVAGVQRDIWPLIEAGKVSPNVARVFPLDQVVEAHRFFESGGRQGKVLLSMTQTKR